GPRKARPDDRLRRNPPFEAEVADYARCANPLYGVVLCRLRCVGKRHDDRLGCETVQRELLFGDPPFDEILLKRREIGAQQATVAVDVLAMCAQPRKAFINHEILAKIYNWQWRPLSKIGGRSRSITLT